MTIENFENELRNMQQDLFVVEKDRDINIANVHRIEGAIGYVSGRLNQLKQQKEAEEIAKKDKENGSVDSKSKKEDSK